MLSLISGVDTKIYGSNIEKVLVCFSPKEAFAFTAEPAIVEPVFSSLQGY